MSAAKGLISAWKVLNNSNSSDDTVRKLLDHIQVTLVKHDIFSWLVCLRGFEGTAYEGGSFLISVQFPQDFPHNTPTLRFLTPIFHPNVGSDGSVSLDFTKIPSVVYYFINLLLLLKSPNPELAINSEAAGLFTNDIRLFVNTARLSVERNATDFQRFTLQSRILVPQLSSFPLGRDSDTKMGPSASSPSKKRRARESQTHDRTQVIAR